MRLFKYFDSCENLYDGFYVYMFSLRIHYSDDFQDNALIQSFN